MLRNVIFCNKFEWFSIICFSLSFPCLACKSVFAFSELDTQNHPGLIDLKWDESVHCWTALCTVLCMFWHFSSFSQRRQSMRLSMDINRRGSRSARFFRRSTLNVKKRRSSTSWCNGTIFNGTTKRQTEKGQKRFVYSWAASWHIVEHIKNRFCTVNWTQIYLILSESQNIVPGPFVCASSAFVVDYFYVVITLKIEEFWS